jgi:ribulose-phosphate 3-epimerase
MRKHIAPSIIAKNQKEFDIRFGKIKRLSSYVHLDVMDGKFVPGKSLNFGLHLPREKKYWAHLMLRNPISWIENNLRMVDGVILHVESSADIRGVINYVKKKNKKVGIALNPDSSVSEVEEYLSEVNLVLVMTVKPGKYGSRFLPGALGKVRELRRMRKKLVIGVDGGINDKTITRASNAGADVFVVGSYLQNSDDPKESMRKLR